MIFIIFKCILVIFDMIYQQIKLYLNLNLGTFISLKNKNTVKHVTGHVINIASV